MISYINDRNRKRNVEDAEKAIMEEIRATRGIKIEDPFTRRQTQPRMSFKANEKRDEPEAMQMPAPPPPGQKKKPDEKRASSSADNNLYSLHDFEIDLDVPLPSKFPVWVVLFVSFQGLATEKKGSWMARRLEIRNERQKPIEKHFTN